MRCPGWLRSDTLLRRICVSLALVSLLAMLAEVGLVVLKYGFDHDALIASGTTHEADIIAASLALRPDGSLAFTPPKALMKTFARYPQDYAFEVLRDDGRVYSDRNRQLLTAMWPSVSWDQDAAWRSAVNHGQIIRILADRYDSHGATFLVRVTLGSDPAGLRFVLLRNEVIDHVLVSMLPLTALVLLVNVLVVRRSLRPLAVAAQHAASLDASRGGLRLASDRMPAEIRVMVRAINQALARVDEVLRFQRDFTSMVAHELRTPLAVLSLRLDAVSDVGGESAKAVVGEMTRLVGQLLRVAQLEVGAVEPKQMVDLAEVARELVERLAPLALDQNRELAFEDRGATAVWGHHDAIMSALRNLVENALRATPTGSIVWLVVGPGASLHVRDHGVGVPPALSDKLFAPFVHGASRHDGTGLGLAIVARTMVLHGGRVWFENLPDGCVFHLTFPGAPA
jgi:signal transduction histidine kinase